MQTTTTQPIKFRKARTQTTCNCNAYAFPHRAGSGICIDPGEDPGACSKCQFGCYETDPYGTGDRWFGQYECSAGGCPWNH